MTLHILEDVICRIHALNSDDDRVFCPSCAYRKPYPGVMPDRNRLSWQDDRAVLLRSGRPGVAIQVEGAG